MCPSNRIGAVDLYLTSHHGLDISGSDVLVLQTYRDERHFQRPDVASISR
jgi:hypothetical protein